MGFIAPSIIHSWSVSRAELGPVFSASLVGMMIGSLALGPLADRIGRRPVSIVTMSFVGVFMLISAAAQSLTQLIVLRLLTGFSLAGIMGNAIALAEELSPQNNEHL